MIDGVSNTSHFNTAVTVVAELLLHDRALLLEYTDLRTRFFPFSWFYERPLPLISTPGNVTRLVRLAKLHHGNGGPQWSKQDFLLKKNEIEKQLDLPSTPLRFLDVAVSGARCVRKRAEILPT